jgi:hypothetical protein
MYELDRRPQATGAPRRTSNAVAETAQRRSPGAPRALHYAASPLSRGGISAAENEAVRRLSGARVDLHAIGATVQAVPVADPRLRNVGARSLTQGRHALVGHRADRGHEIWHLAQQAMGQVRPTGEIGGKPVNASPSLEAEADRMGAAISREAATGSEGPLVSHAGGGVAAAVSNTAPIQRRVTKFEATTSSRIPPMEDLIGKLDYLSFAETKEEIQDSIMSESRSSRRGWTDTPVSIEADISRRKGSKLKRTGTASRTVGKIGADDYFLRTGTHETFEGGHLIPHELWARGDEDSADADDYVNLVPMSRTMNVGDGSNSWRTQEKKMIGLWKKRHNLRVRISVTSPELHEMTYKRIAEIFDLTVVNNNNNKTVRICNWLPEAIELEELSGKFWGNAFENETVSVHGAIEDGGDLVEALKQTPIWSRCNSDMRGKLEGL